MALPSANPSLMSNKTTSLAKFLIAIYSAQLAPTAPAPTTVTFISMFRDGGNFIYGLCLIYKPN